MVARVWLALLLALPVVAAAPGTFSGETGLPVSVTGQRLVEGDHAFVLDGVPGSLRLEATGEGTVTRIVHRSYGLATADPEAEVLWDRRVERIALPLGGAVVSDLTALPGFQLVATGAMHVTSGSGTQQIGALAHDSSYGQQLDRALSLRLLAETDAYAIDLPEGLMAIRESTGRLVVDGPYTLWLSQAQAVFWTPGAHALDATTRVEQHPGGVYDPLAARWFGPGEHDEHIEETLLIEATGRLVLDYASGAATLYGNDVAWHVDGQAVLPAFVGTVLMEDGTRHTIQEEDTRITGRLDWRAHSLNPERAALSGEGDVTEVQYGSITATYDWATLTAVGFGAAVLAGIAWLASHLKGLGVVGGYARVQGPAILEHPVRREIYERVKAHPGITLVQLAEDARLGSSTLTHHLRHLERNAFVTLLRDGRYVRVFDRQSGAFAGERKHAAAALANPVTAAMARVIEAQPGIGQSELAMRFQVTASTVAWHMQRLETARLVTKERGGQRTRYYLGDAWQSVVAIATA